MTSGYTNLPLARDLREALALYAAAKWPANTSLYVAQNWQLDKTTARNLLKGHASDATITKVLRAGGWAMAMHVIGAVIGESLDHHIEAERVQHESRATRLQATRAALLSLRERADDGAGLAILPVGSGAVKGVGRAEQRRRVGR